VSRTTPAQYGDAFHRFVADGTLDEAPESTVQEITGSPPRTFHRWATAHADDFR
jgi:hypothetical protein